MPYGVPTRGLEASGGLRHQVPGDHRCGRIHMGAVRGSRPAGCYRKKGNCVEVAMYWKHWPVLFPQHAPGRKCDRTIELAKWQRAIIERERHAFLGGLIDSDGC